MATIPMDVIHSCILPKLPVKSLTRFKSVSKCWQTIISSPEFIRLHHHHALSSDTNRLFVYLKDSIFHIHELDPPLAPSSLHWHYTEPAPIFAKILSSCEFFLLINLSRDLGLALVNPSTGWYYNIPYPPYNGADGEEHFGMYLDEANHDYKVVRITQTHYILTSDTRKIETEVMVCSLRNNKWRLIKRRSDKCYGTALFNDRSAVIRHLFHIPQKRIICCFDILAEKWTTDVPFPHLNGLESIESLTVLDGLLCVTAVETEKNGLYNCSAWVMKEYGVKDSWFKLMSIASYNYSIFCPIAYRTGSRHEVLCKRSRSVLVFWYNIREKKSTRTTIAGIDSYICKGSLVEFPGGRQMKLHQPKQAEETTRSSER